MTVWVAVIGVVGTVLGGTALSDWLKRRDLRESIKKDLEVWEALPDSSPSKAGLLRGIERRVDKLAVEKHAFPWLLVGYIGLGAFAVTAIYGVSWINGSFAFKRD